MAGVLIVSCGGDDDTGALSESPAPAADDAATGGDAGELADNDARDSLIDAVGDESDVDVDDAIASLSPETRYDIVAGQLEPEPDVEIDGSSIRLVFDDGSVTNAVMDCILASAIQRADETLTLVYPDGDTVC